MRWHYEERLMESELSDLEKEQSPGFMASILKTTRGVQGRRNQEHRVSLSELAQTGREENIFPGGSFPLRAKNQNQKQNFLIRSTAQCWYGQWYALEERALVVSVNQN